MTDSESEAKQNTTPLSIAHVADFCRRYPGEMVNFHTQVDVHQTLPNLTVRITVPNTLALNSYRASPNYGDTLPRVETGGTATDLVWQIADRVEAGTSYEFYLVAQVGPTLQNMIVDSQAVAMTLGVGDEPVWAEETGMVAISAKGRYLQYLPALYQEDELMGRFLMLFESFWSPIQSQLDHISLYFDPRITPTNFLSWLASWIDLALDDRWPEDRRRLLLRSAVPLYQKRGTKRGLQQYLEIFGGQQVEIIEHRARNFQLGEDARLGPGIALGTGNMPHTFTVSLHLPPISAVDETERSRLEAERRHLVETIIETEKPAHTTYTLHIESATTAERL